MISGFSSVMVMARKEFMEHVRSKRIFIIGGVFFATFLIASIIGITVFSGEGTFGESEPGEAITTVLIFYFSIGLIGGFAFTSVLAVVLSADAVCGEWKDKTLFLLLSKPISRTAMLAGKVLGTYVSVAAVFATVFIVCLGVLVSFIGWPGGDYMGRILGGFAIVIIGLLPFVSVGILCSTLFRSPVGSFVVALVLWFLVFPLIGTIGIWIEMAQVETIEDIENLGTAPLTLLLALLSPTALLSAAGRIWAGGEDPFFGMQSMGVPDDPVLVLAAMVAHSVVYLVLSFIIVTRRDYA